MSLVLKSVNEYLKEHSKHEIKKPASKKPQKLFTQITSGVFKGKKLILPSLDTTRSTKSIVRQSFFNTIRSDLHECLFVEGFAGSALMACEAMSNQAQKAIAIEIDKNAYKLAMQNCNSLKEHSPQLIHGDSFKLLPEILQNNTKKTILYLDPPFDIRDGFDKIYEKLFTLISKLPCKNINLICFEASSKYKMPENIADFKITKSKKFGATALHYYHKQ